MAIALVVTDRDCTELAKALAQYLPQTTIEVWPDLRQKSDIKLAVLWKQPAHILQDMPQLQAVCSLGAGIDFIEADTSIPSHLPIHKTVTPRLQQEMAQYVLTYVLEHYREVAKYRQQQNQSEWRVHDLGTKPKVALLGLGEIAEYVAGILVQLSFEVEAYTHSSVHPSIPTHHGTSGLKRLVSDCDYLVNLLPLNSHTENILNLNLFQHCLRKPVLINAGRGGHQSEEDLLVALDTGLLNSAVLDVFSEEPLPADNPLWQHPKITITPHNAARSDRHQTALAIAQLYKELLTSD